MEKPGHPASIAKQVVITGTLLICIVGAASAQEHVPCARAQPGHPAIYGDVAADLSIPYGELRTLPRTSVQAALHDSRLATFEGVTLRELLTRVGVPESLRSGDLSRYRVVEAADGYRAVFALAELDPQFRDSLPILAEHAGWTPDRTGFGAAAGHRSRRNTPCPLGPAGDLPATRARRRARASELTSGFNL